MPAKKSASGSESSEKSPPPTRTLRPRKNKAPKNSRPSKRRRLGVEYMCVEKDEENEASTSEEVETIPDVGTPTPTQNSARDLIDGLLSLEGFDKAAEFIAQVQQRVSLFRDQGRNLPEESGNMSVAIISDQSLDYIHAGELYYKYLKEEGFFPGEEDKYAYLSAKSDCCVKRASGELVSGVLLVNSADQLCSKGRQDVQGLRKQPKIAMILVSLSDTNSDSVGRILASVPLQLTLSHDRGNYRRQLILEGILASVEKKFKGRMKFQGESQGPYLRLYARRIEEKTRDGKEQLDDAIDIALRETYERQIRRLCNEETIERGDYLLLTAEDLLGPKPDTSTFRIKEWDELQEMIGLETVKSSIQCLMNGLLINYYRGLEDQKPLEIGLSRLFLGPPGTGKTTVATLYGKVLAELGILSDGELVTKNASDFIGSLIGESAAKTKEIFEEAKGKVLLIDEAYMLNPQRNKNCSFRQEVADTLVSSVQNRPGEDLCVIMCGYTKEMESFIREANPGLRRRFPLEEAFIFPSFSEEHLGQIFDYKIQKLGVQTTKESREVVMRMLRLAKQRPNFGNGGEIDNIISKAVTNFRRRLSNIPETSRPEYSKQAVLTEADFDPTYSRSLSAGDEVERQLQDLIGLDSQMEVFRGLSRRVKAMVERKADPTKYIPFSFVIKGPPGCGKTTVARKIGNLYYQMGLLSTNEVVEVSSSNMIAGYLGQTAIKTRSLLESALGKVLFIDEAYRLTGNKLTMDSSDHNFASEARDELVDSMTKPDFLGKIVIILAGYESHIDIMLKSNPGLASRFRTHILLPALSSDSCIQLLQNRITTANVLSAFQQHESDVRDMFDTFRLALEWGNGRDVETIAAEIVGRAFENATSDSQPQADGDLVLQTLREWRARLSIPVSRETIRAAGEQRDSHGEKTGSQQKTVYGEAADFPTGESNSDSASLSCEGSHNHQETGGLRLQDIWDSFITIPRGTPSKQAPAPAPTSETLGHTIYQTVPLQDARRETRFLRFEVDENSQITNTSLFSGCLEDVEYRALSYTWDKDGAKSSIKINGLNFELSTSLFDALRQICLNMSRGSALTMWVDAICINQAANAEKSAQVTIMDRIYSLSSSVIIWLGESNDEIDQTMSLMQALKEPSVPYERSHDRDNETNETQRLLDDILKSPPYNLHHDHKTLEKMILERHIPIETLSKGLIDLSTRPWWSRTWTVQEAVLPTEAPTVVCGTFSISWDHFYHLLVTIREHLLLPYRPLQHTISTERVPSSVKALYDAMPGNTISQMSSLRALYQIAKALQVRGGKCENLSLGVLLWGTRSSKSTDPRDKIYALLGMADQIARDCIVVDYNKTSRQVFTETTKWLIFEESGLRILSRSPGVYFRERVEENARWKDWPTWVPIFDECSREFRLSNPPIASEVKGKASVYNASKRLPTYFILISHPLAPILTLFGIAIGKITEVGKGVSYHCDGWPKLNLNSFLGCFANCLVKSADNSVLYDPDPSKNIQNQQVADEITNDFGFLVGRRQTTNACSCEGRSCLDYSPFKVYRQQFPDYWTRLDPVADSTIFAQCPCPEQLDHAMLLGRIGGGRDRTADQSAPSAARGYMPCGCPPKAVLKSTPWQKRQSRSPIFWPYSQSQPMIDATWRTMVGDSFDPSNLETKNAPVPPEAGQAVLSYILINCPRLREGFEARDLHVRVGRSDTPENCDSAEGEHSHESKATERKAHRSMDLEVVQGPRFQQRVESRRKDVDVGGSNSSVLEDCDGADGKQGCDSTDEECRLSKWVFETPQEETRNLQTERNSTGEEDGDTTQPTKSNRAGIRLGLSYCDVEEICRKTIDARSAFRTETGFMGFGPLTTKPGDIVVVVAGGDVPLILRPHEDHFLLVGESYVHGVMFGELFEHCPVFEEGSEETIPLRAFEIR